jgi:uncharacterized protein
VRCFGTQPRQELRSTLQILVLYSNDFVKADSLELIKDVKAAGGTTIAEKYVVTDHSWSDHRIALESLVINWLGSLPGPP